MRARESLVDCQPRKSGTNDYAKFEGWGGGGQSRCTNYGYVKMVLFSENAVLSFLHRWTKTEVIHTMISFIIQRMLYKGCYHGAGFEKVRMGENDSNTLREYAYFFFRKRRKKK